MFFREGTAELYMKPIKQISQCNVIVDFVSVQFTFLGKWGVEDMQGMETRLFQLETIQRSGARHIPDPQHSNLGV